MGNTNQEVFKLITESYEEGMIEGASMAVKSLKSTFELWRDRGSDPLTFDQLIGLTNMFLIEADNKDKLDG